MDGLLASSRTLAVKYDAWTFGLAAQSTVAR